MVEKERRRTGTGQEGFDVSGLVYIRTFLLEDVCGGEKGKREKERGKQAKGKEVWEGGGARYSQPRGLIQQQLTSSLSHDLSIAKKATLIYL